VSFREGYTDRVSVAGLLAAIVILIILLLVVSENVFELTEFARFSSDFVGATSNVGQLTSQYLWRSRTLDVIVQAVLVFAAATCCVAMLRPEKEGRKA
jgi:multisubunit Na+/H+ antiporter MnhB subunit